MYCTQCGRKIKENSFSCSACGFGGPKDASASIGSCPDRRKKRVLLSLLFVFISVLLLNLAAFILQKISDTAFRFSESQTFENSDGNSYACFDIGEDGGLILTFSPAFSMSDVKVSATIRYGEVVLSTIRPVAESPLVVSGDSLSFSPQLDSLVFSVEQGSIQSDALGTFGVGSVLSAKALSLLLPGDAVLSFLFQEAVVSTPEIPVKPFLGGERS